MRERGFQAVRALLRDEAAVDDQLGAGHKGSLIRGEEQYAVSDLDRLAEPAQRRQRDLVVALAGIGRVQHRRQVAGMDAVDPDARGPVAHRRRLCIDPHRALGGAISGVAARTADKPHDRADIDDRAAARFDHLFGGELGAEKDAGLVDGNDLVPALDAVGVSDRAAGDPGIVDEDVDATIVCSVLAISAFHCGSLVTSIVAALASPPALRISAATRSASPPRMSVTMTRAPSCAKRHASASPMPCPAPVMIATLSLRRIAPSLAL